MNKSIKENEEVILSLIHIFLRTKDLLPRKEPLTEGMPLLVQVIKDSTELKGPLVTEKINISGTYTVCLLYTSRCV